MIFNGLYIYGIELKLMRSEKAHTRKQQKDGGRRKKLELDLHSFRFAGRNFPPITGEINPEIQNRVKAMEINPGIEDVHRKAYEY